MSVEPERIFNGYISNLKELISRCNLTITDLRSRLNATTVETIECLHWRIKTGLVQGVLKSLTMDDEMEEEEEVEEEDLYE